MRKYACDCFRTARHLLRRYDRYFLLRHLGSWQTAIHWILPISLAACLFLAAIGDRTKEGRHFLYPFMVVAAAFLARWVVWQNRAAISFVCPPRRRILAMLLLRLVCVVAVFLPFVVLACSIEPLESAQPPGPASASEPLPPLAHVLERFESLFPEPWVRALMYVLLCACITVPFLAVWVGYRRIVISIGFWMGLWLVFQYVGALCRLDPLGVCYFGAGSVIAVCGAVMVVSPLATWRRARPELCLLGFTIPLIVVPLLPVVTLWLLDPWLPGEGVAMPGDAGVFSVVCWLFLTGQANDFAYLWANVALVAGLVYCCVYILVIGPLMHRVWASPK